LPRTHDV
jgi:3-hydroxyisobutyrate dehydrogenase